MKRTKGRLRNAVKADVQKQARRGRAIKGEVKPGLEFGFLCTIANDINKCLFRKSLINPDGGDPEDPEGFAELIVGEVEDWILEHEDDERIARILELPGKVRRWLRERIEDWPTYEERAREIPPVPSPIIQGFDRALCESILEQLPPDLFIHFDDEEPDVEAVREVFFGEGYANVRAQDSRFAKLKNRAVAEVAACVPHLAKYLAQLEDRSKRGWPPKWITSNKGIMDNLSRKGKRHFVVLYGMLREGRIRAGGAVDGDPVLVKPDYAKIERRTGLKPQNVRRYLREMCRWGIIKKVGKEGDKGQMIYSIGKWVKGRGQFPRPVYYLKDTPEMRRALREFDAYREQRQT